MGEKLIDLNVTLDMINYGCSRKDKSCFVKSIAKLIELVIKYGLSPERVEAFKANIPGSYIGDGYSGIDDLKPMFEAKLERNNAYKNTGANLHLS